MRNDCLRLVFAAPILGIIGGAIMFFCGWLWLQSRANKAYAAGEGYGQHDDDVAAGGLGTAKNKEAISNDDAQSNTANSSLANAAEAPDTHQVTFVIAMISLTFVVWLIGNPI